MIKYWKPGCQVQGLKQEFKYKIYFKSSLFEMAQEFGTCKPNSYLIYNPHKVLLSMCVMIPL